MRRFRLTVPALAFVAALVCAVAPAPGGAARAGVRLFHHRQSPTLHVYIADAKAGTIDRFPLIDGVLAATPDGILNVPVASLGIGVAPNGTMYVGDGAGSEILVYAAGAQGNALPIQAIPVALPPIERRGRCERIHLHACHRRQRNLQGLRFRALRRASERDRLGRGVDARPGPARQPLRRLRQRL